MGLFSKKKKRGRKKSRKKGLKLNIRKEVTMSIGALASFVIAGLIIISFTGQGKFLKLVYNFLSQWFGVTMFFLPFVFIASGLVLTQIKWKFAKPHTLLGTLLLFLGFLGLLQGGELGLQTFENIAKLVREPGAYLIFISIAFAGYLIITQTSIAELFEDVVKLFPKKKAKPEDGKSITKGKGGFKIIQGGLLNRSNSKDNKKAKEEDQSFTVNEKEVKPVKTDEKEELPAKVLSNQPGQDKVWEYPPLSILSSKTGAKADRGDINKNAQIIEDTLESFGIKAKVEEVNCGPVVTQYALKIAMGTKLTKVTTLANDLALALAAPTGQIRIEAPIPGRSLVGIEIPNRSSEVVTLKTMLGANAMRKHPSRLAVALGLDVSGEPKVVDISRMPHLLIAGATGSGKSVCINTFLSSMLFRATPQEVKLILVDPKRVELTGYNGIPHLLTPVIVDPKKVVSALRWATEEMDRRYKTLAEVGVKDIDGYNELAGFQAMPYIVIIIDELADVMMFDSSGVEESVTRIAQMARAVGMHLILATQRPSVNVITGLIKANIPTRIAFNVTSMTDSRVILDTPGAEKLLGRGDMLFIPPDQAKPSRLQGSFVSEKETKALIEFIKQQGQQPDYEEDITTKYQSNKVGGGVGGDQERDELFPQAAKLFSQYDKASASLIQRRLSVGYARAARILDQLHAAGLVGPHEGSKPRDVNMDKLKEYLGSLESMGG